MDWLDDDLASRSVADRVAMYRKFAKDKFHEYETEHDRVRLVEDTDGDGVADKASVFADGFHDAAAGIGSGVLARNGNVYYTCIPTLAAARHAKAPAPPISASRCTPVTAFTSPSSATTCTV